MPNKSAFSACNCTKIQNLHADVDINIDEQCGPLSSLGGNVTKKMKKGGRSEIY